jgi:hypothetical protein
MSRKVFTAGEVLAAADVNSFLMDQSVMSFAGTAARGSAIPSPVEGMTTYREDIDRLESYTGSQWTSPGDLVLIKQVIGGTNVASVVVTDAFSANYDNYLILINANENSNLSLQFGSNTTGLYEAGYRSSYGAGALTGEFVNNGGSIARAARGNGIVEVSQPFNSQRTRYSYRGATKETGQFAWQGSGFVDNNTSFTSFTLTPNTGLLTATEVTVFAYRRSN